MARTPQDITDTELAVLQVLWDRGAATIRQIAEVLYPDGKVAHYATVQKLLERLEDKSCVRRDRTSAVHVFSAAVDRDELVGRRLQSVAEKLCGGSWTPLLTHLVQHRKLTREERQALRDLVEEGDRPRVGQGKRKETR
jgi:predicted transcriptional regulator